MMVHMESMDFFVWTDDYLRMKLAEYPGFTSLLTDFLLQFFRWQGVGSSVMVMLMLAMVCMLRLVRRCLGTGVYGMEFLLPVLLLCVVPFSLSVHLTALFFTISLWLLLRWRHVMVWLLWIIVAPWLLVGSLQLMVVLLAAFGCLRCHSVGKYNLLARVLTSVVLAIVSVYAFNEWLGYIPFENRWWCAPAEELNVWMFHLLFLLGALVLYIPVPRRLKIPSAIVVGCIVVVTPFLVDTSEWKRQQEVLQMAAWAEQNEWQQISTSFSEGEVEHNRINQSYAILADWVMGRLPDVLFSYRLNSSEDMLFRNNSKYDCRNFNRKLYEKLGLFDESFRQSYEMGVKCRNGMGFAAMRYMVNYAMYSGNVRVVSQCLEQLSASSTHDQWVSRWYKVMNSMSGVRPNIPIHDSLPLRNVYSLTGCYPLGLELKQHINDNQTGKMALDGALCAFLLDGQLAHFADVLTNNYFYQGKSLPKAYAEAVVMMSASGNEAWRHLSRYFLVNPEYEWRFRQWQETMREGYYDASFKGTFWDYYARHFTPSHTS